jgi:hypothetical protein
MVTDATSSTYKSQAVRTRPGDLFAILGLCTVSGGLFGLLTSIINGLVSQDYFRAVMGWADLNDIRRAAIAEGWMEGVALGAILGVILAVIVGYVSKARCSYKTVVKYIGWIFGGAVVCWIIGGLLGIGLASLSPEFFSHTFIGVPPDSGGRLAYAWVGGSINGATLGAFASTILAGIAFRGEWRSAQDKTIESKLTGQSVL